MQQTRHRPQPDAADCRYLPLVAGWTLKRFPRSTYGKQKGPAGTRPLHGRSVRQPVLHRSSNANAASGHADVSPRLAVRRIAALRQRRVAASPALSQARPQNDARSLADGPHTRTLVGRLWQDARRDVALARTAPPQMEQIHPPRAGVRLGVKSIGVPASGTRYPRRQEPTPTREPNPGHFSFHRTWSPG
jgi:hypothetical protein